MNKSEIIGKIKKCLALGKSTNQHEAAIALRQAQSLMERHSIDPNDPDLLGIVEIKIKGSGIKKPTNYEALLARSIADLMGCKVIGSWQTKYTTKGGKVEHCWKFIGFDPYPEIASYAFDVLFRQLRKARNEYIETKLNRVQIKSNKIKRADMFCMGWVIEATEMARQIKPNLEKLGKIEAHINKTMELVDAKATNRTGNKKPSKSEINDYFSGRKAGENAQLNQAVNSPNNHEAHQLGLTL